MTIQDESGPQRVRTHCCPCSGSTLQGHAGVAWRDFLIAGGLTVGGAALTDLTWSALAAEASGLAVPPQRTPLVVKPILSYFTWTRQEKTSWRSWGGIETEAQAEAEVPRIQAELEKLRSAADFPVEFLPVLRVRSAGQVAAAQDIAAADAIVLYGAGGPQDVLDTATKIGKPIIFFLRHKSGPLSFYYEAISPWCFRHNTDQLAIKAADHGDVVVDSAEELLWRLRALCGLKNTMGSRIVAIGGPGGWATPQAPDLARKKWKLDIQTVPYAELGKLIQQARADQRTVEAARGRAAEYLRDGGVKLETDKAFVENCFVLEQVFRALMARFGTRSITINECMTTIMPMAQTTACLTLSVLNDAGYLAFCESDFVVVPAGILLANIANRPVFLNDPTYPHDGLITLAHCTAPRKMDGKGTDPARIVTHFESDYGAAPKVEMRKGQKVTNIIPDFKAERFTGFIGEIVEAPFLPICRSQIDVAHKSPDLHLAERMPGFHWITCYGDYAREVGYALKKVPIAWQKLG